MLPLRLALFAVRHLYLGVAIVVALNKPFKAKVDQRGMVDDELTRLNFVPIFRSDDAIARTEQVHQNEHRKRNRCILHCNLLDGWISCYDRSCRLFLLSTEGQPLP